jgi:uncharacterized protein YggE
MKRVGFLLCAFLIVAGATKAQSQDIRVVADTLVVQAEGTFEADPDLATLTFDISSQEKELKLAYDKASQAMQKIAALAEKNGLKKDDVLSGVLVVTPFYEGDRKKRTKSFLVQGQIELKIHDFSKIGAIMDESVEDEITDFRSLTYSLFDEEAAKQRAVAEAMRRAVGRANAALEQKGQKVGVLRFANLDVKQIAGISRIDVGEFAPDKNADGAVQVSYVSKRGAAPKAPPPSPVPIPQPKKITVSASVQCGFQIQ